ncbi:hypothetical protein [Noviherbaspirillum cavernae]|nr:hypothetical protein [Noviherbaspirillum cavernae]
MKNASQETEVKTGPPLREDATPRLPNERDESADSQSSGPRRKIRQAYDDLMSGQVDTDLRAERGVDAVVNQTPEPSPVNPLDVPRKKKVEKQDEKQDGK